MGTWAEEAIHISGQNSYEILSRYASKDGITNYHSEPREESHTDCARLQEGLYVWLVLAMLTPGALYDINGYIDHCKFNCLLFT